MKISGQNRFFKLYLYFWGILVIVLSLLFLAFDKLFLISYLTIPLLTFLLFAVSSIAVCISVIHMLRRQRDLITTLTFIFGLIAIFYYFSFDIITNDWWPVSLLCRKLPCGL